ncbi:hypothetical protein SeLEV6574_g04436 [Synchytrium endobioticum]|uniref:Uncharacterized protein n=1 Tax=Synchytrium endobioticum TaxID=286115 RepID=A0A507CZQ3_9FUNG|nr:hypothetical protein SeLEV6574_g04436 [Synchytrium endobioticum]
MALASLMRLIKCAVMELSKLGPALRRMAPSSTTRWPISSFALGGAATVAAAKVIGAAVPYLMFMFGTVVPGVGTLHAAGGAAAVAQYLSAALLTPAFVVSGAVLAIIATACCLS